MKAPRTSRLGHQDQFSEHFHGQWGFWGYCIGRNEHGNVLRIGMALLKGI